MARMERFFSIKKHSKKGLRVRFVCLLVILNAFFAYAQNIVSSPLLRFPIWFVMEEAPSISTRLDENESIFTPAADGIRALSPFFVEALVYGWDFTYTPSDNTRGVSEYFEIVSIITIENDDENLRYTDAIIADEESVVESWVEYDLTKRMVYERHRWHTGGYPSIAGRGESSVFEGVEGVMLACEEAAKNAIRNYARDVVKNKPKEITGKILLTDFPIYSIDAGKYVADLDFFLNVSKIVEYTIF